MKEGTSKNLVQSRCTEGGINNDIESASRLGDAILPNSITNANVFYPICFEANWIDREKELADRITIPVSLPSGIEYGSTIVQVIEDGTVLEITVYWPPVLLEPEVMLSPFI